MNTKTILGRYNYLIELRKKKIRHYERILKGKDKRYNYNLESVKKELESEKTCLSDLLTNELYQEMLKKERMETVKKYV